MVDLREFEFIELHWYQIGNWNKTYILKFDEEEVATLEYPSIWSKKAYGTTMYGDWSIKISGVFKPELTIRRKDSQRNIIAIPIKLNPQKMILSLPSMNSYEWKKIHIMKGEYGWYYKDELIFEFKYIMSLDKKRIKMSFTKPNLPDDDLSLLSLVGTYFMIAIQQN